MPRIYFWIRLGPAAGALTSTGLDGSVDRDADQLASAAANGSSIASRISEQDSSTLLDEFRIDNLLTEPCAHAPIGMLDNASVTSAVLEWINASGHTAPSVKNTSPASGDGVEQVLTATADSSDVNSGQQNDMGLLLSPFTPAPVAGFDYDCATVDSTPSGFDTIEPLSPSSLALTPHGSLEKDCFPDYDYLDVDVPLPVPLEGGNEANHLPGISCM